MHHVIVEMSISLFFLCSNERGVIHGAVKLARSFIDSKSHNYRKGSGKFVNQLKTLNLKAQRNRDILTQCNEWSLGIQNTDN